MNAAQGPPAGRVHKRKAISDQQRRREHALRRQTESRHSSQLIARLASALLVPTHHAGDEEERDTNSNGTLNLSMEEDNNNNNSNNNEVSMSESETEARVSRIDNVGFSDANRLKGRSARQWFSKQFMMPEWMIDIPPRLSSEWYVLPRPAGKRCLVVSCNGTTQSRLRNGLILHHRFPSALPNGSKAHISPPASSFSILDCVFHEPDQTYYVIDMICWKGYPLHDCNTEFRFFWVNSKLQESNACLPPSTYHRHSFKTVPVYECNQSGLQTAYTTPLPYSRDGLLFYNRHAQYQSGITPLCLVWKDKNISSYFIDTDKEGNVPTHQLAVLELQEDGTVGTLDDPPLTLSRLSQEFITENEKNCKPGSLLRFAVNDNGLQISNGKLVAANLVFQSFVNQNRGFPDSWSKILFQYAARNSPLTFEELLALIDCTNEENIISMTE